MEQLSSSVPDIEEFDPRDVPYQHRVIKDIRRNYDYDLGVHQILLSGSVGSAKSLLMAHIIITHCLLHSNAHFGIGRRTMSTLKGTLLDMILKHLGSAVPYKLNKTKGIITFQNGSKITPFSWDDGNYKKVRSYEFSGFAIEELTENDDKEIYTEILMRIRLSHVSEKICINATNPDDPEHWAYKHFIESTNPNIHVYYSLTRENKFLPPTYVSELEANLDPKMAMRMLEGKWIAIAQDVVYYEYDKQRNFRRGPYEINLNIPLHLAFDFNIGVGKPMSSSAYQIRDNLEQKTREFHFFDEAVVEGARTEDIMEEWAARGYFDLGLVVLIHGDRGGNNKSTTSRRSDYAIIIDFLANYKTKTGEPIRYALEVPAANPGLRTRHNLVNAHCHNKLGQVRLFVYEKAKVTDEGMRLTKLKDRGQYIEDDSKYYQHITTAIGYGICWEMLKSGSKKQGSVQL